MPILPDPDQERTAAPGITASRVIRVDSPAPLGIVNAAAPVRICDNGGWTDTWFGGPGRVFNVAVRPGVEVTIDEVPGPDPVVLDVCDFGERYAIAPRSRRVARHPLLEAAIDRLPPPPGSHVVVSVRSAVPPGSGTGTSAALAVAVLGALQALRAMTLEKLDVASAAHRLEVDALGRESGVQDQLCCAFGGINYIEIDTYPEAAVQSLPVWDGLSECLSLVFVGRGHDSSSVHNQVIEDVGRVGPAVFTPLRDAAAAARDAVLAQDLLALGRSMIDNTRAQSALHPALVCADARKVIDAAEAEGAIGWKVNGAGGDGGSVTLLSRTLGDRLALERRIVEVDPKFRVLPVRVSPTGLEIIGSEG
jgi:D-glycero-alpha-D-manno-heptose-7-phosphate kinase